MRNLKICFLINSNQFFNWQKQIIDRVSNLKNIEIFIADFPVKAEAITVSWKLFSKVSKLNKGLLAFTSPSNLANIKEAIKFQNKNIDFNSSQIEFSEFLKTREIDILFNLSSLQVNSVDKLPNIQIWQFNFSNTESNFNFPIAISEIIRGKKVVDFSLIKILSENSAIELRRAIVKTNNYSVEKTTKVVIKEAINLPEQAIIDVLNTNSTQNSAKKWSIKSIKYPSFFIICCVLWKQAINFLKFVWVRGMFVDHWNVGIVNHPVSEFLKPEIKNAKVIWLASNTERFIADSFYFAKNGEQYIFFEGLDYSEGIGYISVAKLENNSLVNEKVIIKEPFHLSYPYIVEENNEVYCIPESNQANAIILYKAVNFPFEWKQEKKLLDEVKGIDSTFVKHDGLWWMFTTLKDDGPHFKLHIYYSDSITGDWKPHLNNPVKIDITASRGAGNPFFHEGKLYRPAQDYSEKIEGRIRMNLITKLTTSEFSEEEVTIVNPFSNTSFPDKIHTLSSINNVTIIDGCKEFFILRKPTIAYFKFKRIANHLLKKK